MVCISISTKYLGLGVGGGITASCDMLVHTNVMMNKMSTKLVTSFWVYKEIKNVNFLWLWFWMNMQTWAFSCDRNWTILIKPSYWQQAQWHHIAEILTLHHQHNSTQDHSTFMFLPQYTYVWSNYKRLSMNPSALWWTILSVSYCMVSASCLHTNTCTHKQHICTHD